MHAMILQASSQSKAGCMCTSGIPIFTSIARLAGFHLTPAVRQTVPPSQEQGAACRHRNWPDRQFLCESRHPRISSNEALFKASN